MRALLLAAGFGTRLRPITDQVPKCLVQIRETPLLEIWLNRLFSAGIERILVNTHYLANTVADFVQKSEWSNRIDLVHEHDLLGTGGTVLANADFFQNAPFIVAHADNLTRFDVSAFIQAHQNRLPGTEITMMTFETDAPKTCGIVELDAHGRVVAFHEKCDNPPGNHANAAVYIFEPSVLQFLSQMGKPIIDLSTEVIPHFLGKIQTFHNADYHRDIGNLESLRLAQIEY